MCALLFRACSRRQRCAGETSVCVRSSADPTPTPEKGTVSLCRKAHCIILNSTRPVDNDRYVRTAPSNPKKVRPLYSDTRPFSFSQYFCTSRRGSTMTSKYLPLICTDSVTDLSLLSAATRTSTHCRIPALCPLTPLVVYDLFPSLTSILPCSEFLAWEVAPLNHQACSLVDMYPLSFQYHTRTP